MTTLGNIADYVGRQADISLFQGVAVGIDVPLKMSLLSPNSSGLVITGVARLAQRFFLEFMTENGSIPSQPTLGSDFMADARLGRIRTTVDAEQSFFLAVNRITINLETEEEEDLPEDEQFAKARLLDISLLDGLLKLRVEVISRAGTSRAVILPVATRIR